MKILKNILFLLFGLSVIFTSCTDIVDVEINDEDLDLYIVEAMLNTKDSNNVYVRLSKTVKVTDDVANPAVSDAEIYIKDLDNTSFADTLVETSVQGLYMLKPGKEYKPIVGHNYELKIITPEGVTITAEEHLMEVPNLDSVQVWKSLRGDLEFFAVFISSEEPAGVGNFYKWDIYVNGSLLHLAENMAFADDGDVDGNYVYELEIFTDFHDPSDDPLLSIGDTVVVEQNSISKTGYDFYLGMVNQAFSGGPFSVPPANLPTNLVASNGKRVIGMFTAQDVSRGNAVIITEANDAPKPDNSKTKSER